MITHIHYNSLVVHRSESSVHIRTISLTFFAAARWVHRSSCDTFGSASVWVVLPSHWSGSLEIVCSVLESPRTSSGHLRKVGWLLDVSVLMDAPLILPSDPVMTFSTLLISKHLLAVFHRGWEHLHLRCSLKDCYWTPVSKYGGTSLTPEDIPSSIFSKKWDRTVLRWIIRLERSLLFETVSLMSLL